MKFVNFKNPAQIAGIGLAMVIAMLFVACGGGSGGGAASGGGTTTGTTVAGTAATGLPMANASLVFKGKMVSK